MKNLERFVLAAIALLVGLSSSSCLLALANRTGKHVSVSLISGAPAVVKVASSMRPGDSVDGRKRLGILDVGSSFVS